MMQVANSSVAQNSFLVVKCNMDSVTRISGTWVRQDGRTWFQKLASSIVKIGPIPKHVAVIMDGNRRFAKNHRMRSAEGHLMGFEKLTETLEWCLHLGITEVTVYAFSIENFKRPAEEVNCLMELAKKKFSLLLTERDKLDQHGVCVRVLGNMSLLSEDLQHLVNEVMRITAGNSRSFLNICMAYTSRDEITHAVVELAISSVKCEIDPMTIASDHISQHLYTSCTNHPELLIRTSGETRLSDFLLWQTTNSVITFLDVLWPEFSIWHLLGSIVYFQRQTGFLQIKIGKK